MQSDLLETAFGFRIIYYYRNISLYIFLESCEKSLKLYNEIF